MTTHSAQVSWHGGKDDLRAHTVRAGGQTIGGSCSPEWGGDDAKADPEALFVASLSACHMLWFLDLARRERLRVTSYEDDAEGEMDGTRFTHVTLRPRVEFESEVDEATLARLHDGGARALLHRQHGELPGGGGRVSALDGVKVLDLSRLLPGGFCSLLMADFGADVLKVEDTGMGDYVRWAPPHYEGAEPSAGSALFLALNRGKRSIRLNLKEEAGREVLLKLVKEYDVLLESFRPGVLDRLGVGYERLREENPGLVYCAITGYGQDGPYRDRSGHDMNYLGLVGLLGLTGDADGPPDPGRRPDRRPRRRRADGGVRHPRRAARSATAPARGSSWTSRWPTARSSWLAMVAARHLAEGNAPRRGDLELAGAYVCYRPYACKDGWVTLGALEPKFWQAWCRGVGREDLIEGQFERPGSDTHAEVERVFLERTRDEWQRVRLRARLLPGAGAGAGRGARLGAGARARDGGGGRAARRREAGPPARQPGEDGSHAGGLHAPRAGARRAHGRGARGARLRRGRDRGDGGGGRGGRPGRRPAGLVHDMSAQPASRTGCSAWASWPRPAA